MLVVGFVGFVGPAYASYCILLHLIAVARTLLYQLPGRWDGDILQWEGAFDLLLLAHRPTDVLYSTNSITLSTRRDGVKPDDR